MDWGTRRKPVGAIVAWSSLAVFAVLSILGIAGMVMGLQPKPVASEVESAALVTEPAALPEERLPGELTFAEAQAVETAAPAQPEAQPATLAVATSDDIIASTFDLLVEPVLVPADQVPPGAVAVPAAGTAIATASVDLPMSKEQAGLAGNTPLPVSRNAAALAIDSEVPDANRTTTALGYAAQPDDAIRVGDSSVNVRSGPSSSNKRLFALAAGAEIDVTGKSGDWVAITDGKDRDGWVDASLLENVALEKLPVIEDVPVAEAEQPASQKKVAGSGVTVRAGPGKSNKALFSLAGGSDVSVLEDSKGWLKVRDAEGRTGWAYKDYIRG